MNCTRATLRRFIEKWSSKYRDAIAGGRGPDLASFIRNTVADFNAVPVSGEEKPRVGIVGKYWSSITLEPREARGPHRVRRGEAVLTDMASFLLYCLCDPVFSHRELSGRLSPAIAGRSAIAAVEFLRRPVRKALEGTRFGAPHNIYSLRTKLPPWSPVPTRQARVAAYGRDDVADRERCQKGDMRPALCVPSNHITGKGVIKELRRRYPGSSILALDYDPARVPSTR
jgi:predicted nucleotide-binding protein (sugar kinase/HSP70/actin superfamily)